MANKFERREKISWKKCKKKLQWAKNGAGKNIRMENSSGIQIVIKKMRIKKINGKKTEWKKIQTKNMTEKKESNFH